MESPDIEISEPGSGMLEIIEGGNWVRHSHIYGVENVPAFTTRHKLLYKGKEIFNVIYKTDPYGRRITPVKYNKRRNYFIAFFGGSFTFGQGVGQNETLPYHVGTIAFKHQPYNYGVRGTGANQMLSQIQNRKLKKEIPQKRGIGIYVFIDPHIRRTVGGSKLPMDYPYYYLDNGILYRKGSFESGRPILTKIYQMIDRSNIGRYLKINLPLRITQSHINLLVPQQNLWVNLPHLGT